MEPKLTKQSEAILVRLKKDVEKQLLTKEQFEFLRKAMLLQESMGMVSRFVITFAGFIGVVLGILNFWSWGGK